jgi:hypothetical protein
MSHVCLTYARRTKGEELLVAINLSSRPFFGNVEVSSSSGYEEITPDVNPPLPPDTPAPERPRQQATGWVTCFVAGRLGLQVLQKSVSVSDEPITCTFYNNSVRTSSGVCTSASCSGRIRGLMRIGQAQQGRIRHFNLTAIKSVVHTYQGRFV